MKKKFRQKKCPKLKKKDREIMVEKQWTEVENKNGRLINEISDQNQGGNEKKILDEKNGGKR